MLESGGSNRSDETLSVSSRFRRAAAWSLVGALISRGALLIGTFASARMLGAAGLGEFGTIQSTTTLVGVFAGLGLATTAARFVSQLRSEHPSRCAASVRASLYMSLAVGIIVAGATVPFTSKIASGLLAAPHLGAALRWSLPLIPASAVLGVLTGTLLGYEEFRLWTILTGLRGILGGVGSVVGARVAGVGGMTAGFTSAEVISAALFGFFLRRKRLRNHPFDLVLTLGEVRPVLQFGVPAMLSGIAVMPALWFGRLLLIHQAGGFTQAGLFDAATKWGTLVLFVPSSIAPIQLPLLSNLLATGNSEGFRRVVRETLLISTLSCALPSLLLAACSPWFMAVYGSAFRVGWPVLVIVLLGTIPNALNTVLGQALISVGAVWRRFAWDCLLAAVIASSAYWLIAPLGALGLGAALLMGYSVIAVVLACDLWLSGVALRPRVT